MHLRLTSVCDRLCESSLCRPFWLTTCRPASLGIVGPRTPITELIRDLSLSSVGSQTTLGGWLTSRRQANASLAFFTLKDTYSSIQLLVSEPKLIERLMEMPLESVIQVEGMVKPRLKKAKKGGNSSDMADELEIGVEKVILLNPADKVLPFYPNHPELVSTGSVGSHDSLAVAYCNLLC